MQTIARRYGRVGKTPRVSTYNQQVLECVRAEGGRDTHEEDRATA
jgi:hypothetical protein